VNRRQRQIERVLREPGFAAECAYPGCPAKTDNRLSWGYWDFGATPGGLPDGILLPGAATPWRRSRAKADLTTRRTIYPRRLKPQHGGPITSAETAARRGPRQ
jgi:hypothetical protein